MKYRGRVVRRTLSAGSKSEHEGLMLVTESGEFTLRRKGGNPFRDDTLAPLEGKEIECEGTLRGKQIVMKSWKVI